MGWISACLPPLNCLDTISLLFGNRAGIKAVTILNNMTREDLGDYVEKTVERLPNSRKVAQYQMRRVHLIRGIAAEKVFIYEIGLTQLTANSPGGTLLSRLARAG
jgi:hypothetical protein